jgi:hypothetical protein
MKKIELTEEQARKNSQILADLEAERQRLVEETRALQQQFRRKVRRKRNQTAGDGEISAVA